MNTVTALSIAVAVVSAAAFAVVAHRVLRRWHDEFVRRLDEGFTEGLLNYYRAKVAEFCEDKEEWCAEKLMAMVEAALSSGKGPYVNIAELYSSLKADTEK